MKSYAFTRQRCLSVWACGIAISRRPAIKKSSCGWKKQHVASVMNPSKLSLYGKFGTKTDGFTDEGLVDHSAGDGAHVAVSPDVLLPVRGLRRQRSARLAERRVRAPIPQANGTRARS